MCQKLTAAEWGKDGQADDDNTYREAAAGSEARGHNIEYDRKETILHLAASLGLSRLVCSLLHWAAEHPGKQIGMQVDALAQDKQGFTPLVIFRLFHNIHVFSII